MFLRIWRFRPAAARRDEFEAVYGSDGEWAALFARGDGFRGTALIRSAENADEYLTIDRWDTQESWEAFRSAHATEYDALDRRCESLTDTEEHIGDYLE